MDQPLKYFPIKHHRRVDAVVDHCISIVITNLRSEAQRFCRTNQSLSSKNILGVVTSNEKRYLFIYFKPNKKTDIYYKVMSIEFYPSID